MAWLRAMGGQSGNPNVKYLYRDGNEATKITGGWTTSGYSYAGGFSVVGGITKGTTQFNLGYPSGYKTACVMGTVNKVDLSGYTKLIIKSNTSEYVINVASINTTKYISFCTVMDGDWHNVAYMAVTDDKSNVLNYYTAIVGIGGSSVSEIRLEK